MKVWKVFWDSYGETDIYTEDTDVTQIPGVATELGYLEGAYEEEREEFIASVQWARDHGHGTAYIEERLSVELVEVN